MHKYLNYFLIIVGASVAIYAQAEQKQNTAILLVGIVVLMLGIYRVSKQIPSKNNEDENV
ncbi:MAG: hypothetical protein ACPG6B_06210 [Oceanihabitans sp.]